MELVETAALVPEALRGAMATLVITTSGSKTHRAIAIRVFVSASHLPEVMYPTPELLLETVGAPPDSVATTLSFPCTKSDIESAARSTVNSATSPRPAKRAASAREERIG